MKTQLRKLDLIFKHTQLEADMFYSISVRENEITLQGEYTSEKVLLFQELFGCASIRENGFIHSSKNNIHILLT